MSFDDQIQHAVDRALTAITGQIEGDVRAFAQDLIRLASIERSRAVAEAAQATAADLHELETVAEGRIAELTQAVSNIQQVAAAEGHEFSARIARLAETVRALDEAPTLGDVLDTLTEGTGREVDRVAVLLVKGDRLEGWRLSGFGVSAGPAESIDLSLAEAGLPGVVVRTGVTALYPAVDSGPADVAQASAPPPFARDAGARDALALPVIVGGAVVAVVYADTARFSLPSSQTHWSSVLEVMVRHTSRVLEAMTVQELVRSLTEGDRSLLGSVR